MAHGPWPGLPPASPLPRMVIALAHFSRLPEANDICHGNDPLPQRSTWKPVEGAQWSWLKPMQLFLQIRLCAAGSAWFSPNDTKLTQLTFSWRESLGLLLCPGLCHGSTSLDILYTLHMMLCGTSTGTSFRACWLVWEAVVCWCEWLALGQARYSGQTHHTAVVHTDSGRAKVCNRKVHNS